MTNHMLPSWPDQSLELVNPKQGRIRNRVHALVQVFENGAEIEEEPSKNRERSMKFEEKLSLL